MKERGAASLMAVVVVTILLVAGAGLGAAGRVVAAHVQATAAADAAALAAAPLTFLGGDPRAEAATYAARNGGRLEECRCPVDRRLVARVVTVEVSLALDPGILGVDKVWARAAAEFDPLDLLGGLKATATLHRPMRTVEQRGAHSAATIPGEW